MAKTRTTKAGKEPATKQSRAKATPTPRKATAKPTAGTKSSKERKAKAASAKTKADTVKKGDNPATARSKATMLAALKKSLGIVTKASDMCGVTRERHYKWLAEDPAYAREVNTLDDVALDFAESALHRQIEADNATSTIFYLKTKGKKRGYVERTEHIVETTENLATRISYEQAQNLLANAGLEPAKKSDALTADE